MYEEDRLRALELYSRMFEDAADESALIQSLLSPTRQAVVVARAYNTNLGKLSVTTETKAAPEDRDENGIPDYVQAIEAVRAAAFARQPAPARETPEEPAPAEEASEETEEPAPAEEASEEAEEPAPAEEASEETEEPAPAEKASEETEEPAPAEEAPEETEEPAPAEEAPEEAEETAPAEEEPEETEEPAPAVEEPEAPEEAAPAAEAPAPAENKTQENIEFFSMPEEGKEEAAENEGEESVFNIDTDLMRQPRRKAKVFALIVYILFAIPLTLAAIVILLVPAVLFLALSVASIICGIVVVSTALNGFAVIADIMVVLGLALVLRAVRQVVL